MKKIKKVSVVIVIIFIFIVFLVLTFSYSHNLSKNFVPKNTLVYLEFPNQGLNVLRDYNPLSKISSLKSNLKPINDFSISEIENLALALVKKENKLEIGVIVEFKQKDKLKNLAVLDKESVLKIDSNILGIQTDPKVFSNFRKEGFKNNFLNSFFSGIKLVSKKIVGNIYFDFSKFKDQDIYFNNFSGLKSSVLNFNKEKKEISFNFKTDSYSNFKNLESKKFKKDFVVGYKDKRSIENILDNLKKSLSLDYPVLKEITLPDGSKFLEKIADPKEFVFQREKVLGRTFYILDKKDLDLIVVKIGENILFSNNKKQLKEYIKNEKELIFKGNLFLFLPDIYEKIEGLYLKQINGLTQVKFSL